jgi:hypothetical protein
VESTNLLNQIKFGSWKIVKYEKRNSCIALRTEMKIEKFFELTKSTEQAMNAFRGIGTNIW